MVRDCPPQDITVPFKSSGLLTVVTTLMVDELNSVTLKTLIQQYLQSHELIFLIVVGEVRRQYNASLCRPTGVHCHSNSPPLTVHLYMASSPGQVPFSTFSSPGIK